MSGGTTFRLADPRHESVRRQLLARYGSSSFRCREFSVALAREFPELKSVAGFYFAPGGASHGEHWWLVTEAGDIVDPTADQFPSQGTGRYEAYDPHRHLTCKGRCMNCGMGVFSRLGTYPCSESCAQDIAAEWGCRPASGPFDADMELTCDADIFEKYGLALKSPYQDP